MRHRLPTLVQEAKLHSCCGLQSHHVVIPRSDSFKNCRHVTRLLQDDSTRVGMLDRGRLDRASAIRARSRPSTHRRDIHPSAPDAPYKDVRACDRLALHVLRLDLNAFRSDRLQDDPRRSIRGLSLMGPRWLLRVLSSILLCTNPGDRRRIRSSNKEHQPDEG